MKTKHRVLLLVVALAVGYSPAAADTLKCRSIITIPGYDPVTIVDGALYPYEKIGELALSSLEIKCWDPKSGMFSASAAGVQVVIIQTKEFASSDDRVAAHDEWARKAMQELWDEVNGDGPGGKQ